jgi:hypothetical protein
MAALDRPSAPESDYGSDFSIEEESIVTRLLDHLDSPQTQHTPGPVEHTIRIAQADLDAAIAADLFVTSPLSELDREHVLSGAASVVATYGQRGSLRQAKTPASARPDLPVVDIEDTFRLSSLPLDGVSYPDRKLCLAV